MSFLFKRLYFKHLRLLNWSAYKVLCSVMTIMKEREKERER